ncbi:hypothetical protein BXT84_00565 [Sulfobacillus thermotolerans]|uniref:Uncharacterized protein n=1 Tax=Sulfobacillus thermotolerans TaxID=338644 RepID=A0ABN5GZP5_9FIRM|nr:hypothetical protein BXT84_00565 [Sulfobacillus thermotolerans]
MNALKLETKRALVSASFLTFPVGLLTLELADLIAGVVEPIGTFIQQAKRHPPSPTAPPPVSHIPKIWHSWVHAGGYLPWRGWPSLMHHPFLLLGAVGLTGLVGLGMAWKASRVQSVDWGGPKAAGKGQHGTAHWRRDLTDGLYRWTPPERGSQAPAKTSDGRSLPQYGFYVAAASLQPKKETLWISNRDEHMLLIGTTGAGKTRREYLPAIGILGSQKQTSFVISDLKGEIYGHTAQWLKSQGYDILRIDLRNPRQGGAISRFNPVQAVSDALERGDDGQAARIAWSTAHAVAFQDAAHSDPFWPQASEAVIAALILGVAQGAPAGWEARWHTFREKYSVGHPDWTHFPHAEEKHMGTVYRSLVHCGDNGSLLDEWFQVLLPDGHPAQDAWATAAKSQDRTRASILTSAQAAMRLWSEPEIRWLTAAQGHQIDDVGRKLTAVFLVLDDLDGTRYPLATLYLTQMLQALGRLADSHAGRLPVPIMFLLDEFGNFPPIADFDHVVTMARSRGMRFLIALQSFAQLDHRYGKEVSAIIRQNLTLWQYLLTSDPVMAKEISDRLGQYTTQTHSSQMPKVSLWSASSTIGHSSEGQSLTGRPLLTPDEIMRWPEGYALVLQQRKSPAKLTLPDISAYRSLWPDIQTRQMDPVMDTPTPAVTIWHPPDRPENAAPRETPREPDTTGEGKEGRGVEVTFADNATADLFVDQAEPIDWTDMPE